MTGFNETLLLEARQASSGSNVVWFGRRGDCDGDAEREVTLSRGQEHPTPRPSLLGQ